MSRYILSFFLALFCLTFGIATFAQDTETTTTTTQVTSPNGATTVERKTITTTVPAPKIVLPAPSGFVTCFTIKAGWYQNVWAADHNVCQYENSPEGVVWVEGYWACNKYDASQGICTNWDWKEAHWEKTVTVY